MSRKATDGQIIAAARALYANNHFISNDCDVEIDDKPALSHSKESRGCWGQAWVWVYYSDADMKEERT